MNDLQKKVIEAISKFIGKDKPLLSMGAHEQAISHRIAVYLEDLFPEENLNIDCEYNKHLDSRKVVDLSEFIDLENYESCGCNTCRKIETTRDIKELEEREFRPDILVHHRGYNDHNQIVIEVKKTNSCPFDIAKLMALTLNKEKGGVYEYRIGVHLYFQEDKPVCLWFSEGKQI